MSCRIIIVARWVFFEVFSRNVLYIPYHNNASWSQEQQQWQLENVSTFEIKQFGCHKPPHKTISNTNISAGIDEWKLTNLISCFNLVVNPNFPKFKYVHFLNSELRPPVHRLSTYCYDITF